MPNIDTSKVKAIAGEMIDINNRYRDDFSAVEQAINRLRTDWQQPQKVSSAAFACFDEIKSKYFDSAIGERQELAQYLCDAVGIGYEEVENTNKKLLEGLFADSEVKTLNGTQFSTHFAVSNIRETIGEAFENDKENINEIFEFIDNKYASILNEPARNLLKKYILEEIKYGNVAYVDIYEVLRDIGTENFDVATIGDIVSIYYDLSGQKSLFSTSLITTLKILPPYLAKTRKYDVRSDQYLKDGNFLAAIYTRAVNGSVTIVQGTVDGVCKIIDKTLRLSDVSDAIEIISGGSIDIGGWFATGGKGISDAVDYITNIDNFKDISEAYKSFYGGISEEICETASDVKDFLICGCDSVKSFFAELF